MRHTLVFLILAFLSSTSEIATAQWETLDNAPTVFDAFTQSGGYTFVAAGGLGVYRISTTQTRWDGMTSGLPMLHWMNDSAFYSIRGIAANRGILYAGSDGHGSYRSTNLGISWDSMNSGSADTQRWVTRVAAYDSVVIILSDHGALRRSTDQGSTWSNADSGLSQLAYSFVEIGKKIVALTAYGELVTSTDYGQSWVQDTAHKFPRLSGLVRAGNTIFTIPHYSIGVWYSTDSGVQWKKLHTFLPDTVEFSFAASEDAIFLDQSDTGILMSTNLGQSWRDITANLSKGAGNDLNAVGDYLYYGTRYRRTLHDLLDVPLTVQSNHSTLVVHPNPARSVTNVEFASRYNETAYIELCDNVGRTVTSYHVRCEEDKTVIPLDLKFLPSGVYWIRVTTAAATLSESVIVP